MGMRIGINGFGRIGRLVFRAAAARPDITVVGVNDLVPADNLGYLLKYDSTHGKFDGQVATDGNRLVVNGQRVQCLSERDAEALPWRDLEVDYVVESTGFFTDHASASKHLLAGASRVLISAPTKTPAEVPTYVLGVNHEQFEPERDKVLSNASCTTNCLAPVAKVIDEGFGLAEGLMTTVHAATSSQPTQDGPSRKDWRGGRNAYMNLIPSSTGAAKAVALVMPKMEGRLTGMSVRVPTADVSVMDLTFRTESATSYQAICTRMKEASEQGLTGILGYTDESVVSSDFIGCPLSSIFDASAGLELNDRFFKVISWYDNEWGYSNRVVDMLAYMGLKDGLIGATSAASCTV